MRGRDYDVSVSDKLVGKKLQADVYIRIKEPKKTVIATVDVVKQEVIGINETGSWISIER